ncbi:nucleoside hydrolase [Phycicoccus sp. Soil802]|uniref:nucleoside hydrolase n=1 Tax=Phycicoccus sp. Soil802 TaxID=1736414 RepID=UPI0007039CB7|nr:nucleoside hydrolase [Phycicoccus sp. Soil802]KRF28433.1 hypothetical protein ASG91_08225 [Phycicoccus sp. Soil802]
MRVLIDTDIGTDVDDALALGMIVGSPELELVGITTVYGDTRLRAQIARRLLRINHYDLSLPIAAGMQQTRSGKDVCWSGHEGNLFHNLDIETVADDGVDLLLRMVAANPGEVDILAIGPLTNIAAALDADLDFESNVRRLVVMGGDFRAEGRIAEHNFESDVAAAQRVFSSRLDIVIGSLDLTLKIRLESLEIDQIAKSGPLGAVLADEVRVWWRFNEARGDTRFNSPHDPVPALWMAKPDLFTAAPAHVHIDNYGFSRAQIHRDGPVRILGVRDPHLIKTEIVRRILNASAGVETQRKAGRQ